MCAPGRFQPFPARTVSERLRAKSFATIADRLGGLSSVHSLRIEDSCVMVTTKTLQPEHQVCPVRRSFVAPTMSG
jgi:hypothetical protein